VCELDVDRRFQAICDCTAKKYLNVNFTCENIGLFFFCFEFVFLYFFSINFLKLFIESGEPVGKLNRNKRLSKSYKENRKKAAFDLFVPLFRPFMVDTVYMKNTYKNPKNGENVISNWYRNYPFYDYSNYLYDNLYYDYNEDFLGDLIDEFYDSPFDLYYDYQDMYYDDDDDDDDGEDD